MPLLSPLDVFNYSCICCRSNFEDEFTEDNHYTGSGTAYVKKVEDDVDFYNVIESLNSVEDFLNDPAVENVGQEDFCTINIIESVFDYPENACITEFNEVNLPLKLTIDDMPYYIVWDEVIIVDAPSSESSTQE
ncbi:MAG: hypothetical protein J6O61_02430 [Butyrivibrio sp.]|uniref:hypothetical protein n=1 Tax=Butyrivibrio sp. TaxID=28121 RepID=UPI001B03E842|nr:hypothetical protein [Butyrivibrio sp.]MBO6239686.1 hypothetical protein [Butyrivibrio sp.]